MAVENNSQDGDKIPVQKHPWIIVTFLLIQFLVFPLILLAVSGVNAWQEGPRHPHIGQIAVGLITAALVMGIARLYWRPKLDEAGQPIRPDFWLFLLAFLVTGSASIFNVIIGVFTGLGPQVFMGLGFCYFLYIVTLVPLYFKMRRQFRT